MGKPSQFSQDLDKSIRTYPVLVDGMGRCGVDSHTGVEWESPGSAYAICKMVGEELDVPIFTLYTQWCLYAPNFVDHDSFNILDHGLAVDLIFWIAEWLKETKVIWPPEQALNVGKPGSLVFKTEVDPEAAGKILVDSHHYFSVPPATNPRFHALVHHSKPEEPLAVVMVSDAIGDSICQINRLFYWWTMPAQVGAHIMKLAADYERNVRGIDAATMVVDPNLPFGNWIHKQAGYKQRGVNKTTYAYIGWGDTPLEVLQQFGLTPGYVPQHELALYFGTDNLIQIEQEHGIQIQQNYGELLDTQTWSKRTKASRKKQVAA